MCQGGKVGRKFPHLTNSYAEDQIEKKRKIKEKWKIKGKIKKKEKKKRKEKEGRKVIKKEVRVG